MVALSRPVLLSSAASAMSRRACRRSATVTSTPGVDNCSSTRRKASSRLRQKFTWPMHTADQVASDQAGLCRLCCVGEEVREEPSC